MHKFAKVFILNFILLALAACLHSGASVLKQSFTSIKPVQHLSLSFSNLGLSTFKEIKVNISKVEIEILNNGVKTPVVVKSNWGTINILDSKFDSGMNLMNLDIPNGAKIASVKMYLSDDGHFAVRENGSLCFIESPSEKFKLQFNANIKNTTYFGETMLMGVSFLSDNSLLESNDGACEIMSL